MQDQNGRRQPVRAAAAAFFGTMIEWYDFYCYATAAALVFGDVFFATNDPFMGTLASLGTFAIGFFARPVGAVLFGHLGDRVGRKQSLVITLLLMGVATTLIGLLPSYHSIGLAAVVLLVALRLVQGIAVGGEWGGAVLIAAEHAPPKWRTFLASAPQYGSPIGLILATGVFRLVSDLPKEDFLAWGWRLPFIVSGVLVLVAFVIRRGVNESPELEARLKEKKRESTAPISMVLRERKRALLLGIGLCLLGISGFYFVTTLMITYTTTYLKITRSQILDVVTWAGVVELIVVDWLVRVRVRADGADPVGEPVGVNVGPAADRDPHLGPGQGGGVVGAVTHKGNVQLGVGPVPACVRIALEGKETSVSGGKHAVKSTLSIDTSN